MVFSGVVNLNRALCICSSQNLNLHGFNKVVRVEIVKGFSSAFKNVMANGRRHLCPFELKDWADLMELTNEQEYCQPMGNWGKD